ncbi:MAG: hypothetical protein LKG48_00680 [Lachnospiraceae bacterium]|jgi:hypothetical protein|nr:hypothetical protein [Lachnospiraceae bacterium]MCH4064759.1 hypothetical protein [Lachnospiraceae bacterium]MCH4103734.1 hypothetical protein [Lachnospiraceae bacterium]MCI1308281.1 hypothetical protein [Lachnospiraceae bacterium]MCI1332928.1 hypothetical protein [Lachnospiraceae bacterium]
MESEEFRRQKEENKKRFKTMTIGQKLGFFRDYYLLRTVIIVGICAAAVFLIWNFVRPQTKDILTVYVYDQYLGDDASDALAAKTEKLLGAGKREEVLIRSGLSSSNTQDTAIASVLSFNNAIDVIICPKDQFETFAGYGYFLSLDDVLSDEEKTALSDKLVAAAGYQESDNDSFDGTAKGEALDYGIDLGSSSVWNSYAETTSDEMVAGIVSTTKNRGNAVKFLDMLCDLS